MGTTQYQLTIGIVIADTAFLGLPRLIDFVHTFLFEHYRWEFDYLLFLRIWFELISTHFKNLRTPSLSQVG